MGQEVWIPDGADYLVTREGHLLLLPARSPLGWAALTETAQSYGLLADTEYRRLADTICPPATERPDTDAGVAAQPPVCDTATS